MLRRTSLTVMALAVAVGVLAPAEAYAENYFLPSSAYAPGANGADFRTSVRILNPGTSAVTVTATIYGKVHIGVYTSRLIRIEGRSQVAFDNFHEDLYPRPYLHLYGVYGPVRFDASGPLVIVSSVNNVNACGEGAVSGQWLPALTASDAMTAGVIPQVSVSGSAASGYRTNFAVWNAAGVDATVRLRVRRGDGSLLASTTIGPMMGNDYRQLTIDHLPEVVGTTDANLWIEFESDLPVFAYATVIHNVSGDPFAVLPAREPAVLGPNEVVFTLPGGVPLVMVPISAGTFNMGSPPTELGRENREELRHPVTLTSNYYLGKYEVTQAQWRAVMGFNPSEFTYCPGNCPVEKVSWDAIRDSGGFLDRLNALLQTTKFRLPTEAEWERAARGGTETRFSFGDALDWTAEYSKEAMPYMWYCGNSCSWPQSVGTRLPNPFGLYDMHGNVFEWVEDWYEDFKSMNPVTDPRGPTKGTYRVLRGGCFQYPLASERSAARHAFLPNAAPRYYGFRVAMSP